MSISPGAFVLRFLIRSYQLLLSPVMAPACRFHPSCSAYGVEAVTTHGAVKGGWLTLRRIARCHPWNPGGYDPVPPATRADTPSTPHNAGNHARST